MIADFGQPFEQALAIGDRPFAGEHPVTKAEICRGVDCYISDLRAIERALYNVPHRAMHSPRSRNTSTLLWPQLANG
jgi:hypothetical protein